MTRHHWIWVFAAPMALLGLATTGISAQGLEKTRRVPWSSEIPLKDVVRPGDAHVSVLKPEHYEPFVEEDTAERELAVRAADAGYVIVADITSLTPLVTDDGTWVTTKIGARVSQVLRQNDQYPQKMPGTWQIVQDGGELLVDGVVVKVGMYPVVKPGGRYLIFTWHDRKRDITHLGPSFLIDARGTLVTSETSIDGPLPSVMNGMNLSEVARLLRDK
jgi:hypothetical protein